MFDAQKLFLAERVLTPWMPRGGDNVTVFLQGVDSTGTDTRVSLSVYHKNREDVGSGAPVSGGALLGGPGAIVYKRYEGLKEMVRYALHVTSTSTEDSVFIQFRTLGPVWDATVGA